jgi:hypothetical protein
LTSSLAGRYDDNEPSFSDLRDASTPDLHTTSREVAWTLP